VIAVVDNDIVHKGLRYGLLAQISRYLGHEAGPDVGVLGQARFVIAHLIRRHEPTRGSDVLLRELEQFVAAATVLEPTEAESQLAADVEFAAQQHNIPLDTGESQLCAVVLERGVPTLLTGDKRAIAGMEELMSEVPRLIELSGKVRCLEQAILALLQDGNPLELRAAICTEPTADLVLAICFSCISPDFSPDNAVECLNSYINALRKVAPRALAN
jgi:hypothetical protein